MTFGLGALVASVFLLMAYGTAYCYRKLPRRRKELLKQLTETYTLATKLKVLIGFYMVATKVDDVYDVQLPNDVRLILKQLSLIFTLGIDLDLQTTPLECLGLEGYTPRMVFLTVAPFVLVACVLAGVVVHFRLRHRRLTWQLVILRALPFALRLLFLIYPVVTQVAFQPFTFHEFEEGSWLRADVRIKQGSAAHTMAVTAAVVAIMLYPVGLLLLFGSLLLLARQAILSGIATDLSAAITFLHSDYAPSAYWWECVGRGCSHTPCALEHAWNPSSQMEALCLREMRLHPIMAGWPKWRGAFCSSACW